MGRQRVAGLVAGQVERHGQVLTVQRRGELRRPDALGLAVVAERASDDRATEPVPLPGPGLLDHDLHHLTGSEVALDVAQRSETRLGVQRTVGRQLGPQIPHAAAQAPLGLQQLHVALGRVQERDERIEPLGADEVPPVGVGVDGGVQRRHRRKGHADVHVQVQLDGAAEPHRASTPSSRWRKTSTRCNSTVPPNLTAPPYPPSVGPLPSGLSQAPNPVIPRPPCHSGEGWNPVVVRFSRRPAVPGRRGCARRGPRSPPAAPGRRCSRRRRRAARSGC